MKEEDVTGPSAGERGDGLSLRRRWHMPGVGRAGTRREWVARHHLLADRDEPALLQALQHCRRERHALEQQLDGRAAAE